MNPLKTFGVSPDYEQWPKEERLYSTEPWLMSKRKTEEDLGNPADIVLNGIGKNDENVDLPTFLPPDAKKAEISDFVDKIYEEQRRQCELGIPYQPTETAAKKRYKQKGYQCKKGEKKNGQPRKKRELVARAHVSYFVVSGLALLNSRGPILSRDIYRFAKYYFPGCVTSSHWKNSIRNILSTQEFFVKIENQFDNSNSATWTWNRDHLPKLETAIEDLEKTLKQPEFFGMSDPSQWPAIKAGTAGHPDKDVLIDIDEKIRNSSSPTPSMPSEDDLMSPRLDDSTPVVKKGKRKSPSPPSLMEQSNMVQRPTMNPQQLAQFHLYQQQQQYQQYLLAQQQQYQQYLQAYYYYNSQRQAADDIYRCQIPSNQKSFFDGDIDEMVKQYLVDPFVEQTAEGQSSLAAESSPVVESCQMGQPESFRMKTEPMAYEAL